MTVDYRTGDVLDQIRQLPDASVDLVATSPPFLALRDYNGQPGQWGSEPDPASFLDHLLELTAELRRVLAPHGSIAIEIGDSFSGSGGSGGDYADGGWRSGQQRFSATAATARSERSGWTVAWARWLAGIIDAEGYIGIRRQTSGRTGAPSFMAVVRVTMMDRQVVDKCAEVTGVGSVSQDSRGAYSWAVSAQQARYVLTNIWPDLLIKKRQALAGIELQRRIEEVKGRGLHAELSPAEVEHREMIRSYVMALNGRGERRGTEPPCWAPPEPERVFHQHHSHVDGWPAPKSLCGTPTLFAWSLAYGRNLLRPDHTIDPWLVRNMIVWARNNPPVGALGDKVRPATSYITVATPSPKRWFDLDAVRTPHMHPNATHTVGNVAPNRGDHGDPGKFITNNPAGAPPLDHWHDEPDGDLLWLINTQGSSLAHYAMWPPRLVERLILSMCPAQVCRTCGEPRRRITGPAEYVKDDGAPAAQLDERWRHGRVGLAGDALQKQGHLTRVAPTLGWSDCGHGDNWRPGHVLDCFAGSGTTLACADILGRDATGIDLDPANPGLYPARYAQCWAALKPGAGPSPITDAGQQLGLAL